MGSLPYRKVGRLLSHSSTKPAFSGPRVFEIAVTEDGNWQLNLLASALKTKAKNSVW